MLAMWYSCKLATFELWQEPCFVFHFAPQQSAHWSVTCRCRAHPWAESSSRKRVFTVRLCTILSFLKKITWKWLTA